MALTREAFFGRNTRRYKDSRVMPGACIQSLNAEEMRKLRASFQTKGGDLAWKRVNRINELLICLCLCDENRQTLFTEEHAFSVDMDRMDGAVIAALGAEIKEHVGWNADADLTAIEEAEKNSERTRDAPPS